jgi:arylsulfatase A-like enzyme
MGFEYFYRFMGGETDQWTPYLFRNQTQIFPWVGKPGYNLTTDLADEAIKYMQGLNAAAPDKPFFCYYVPGGTHAPHHPTTEWIEKFKGKFDMGWNALYQRAFTSIGLPIRGVTTQFPTLASIQVSWIPSWPA